MYFIVFKLRCFTKYIEIVQNRRSLIKARNHPTDMSDTVILVQPVIIIVLLLSLVVRATCAWF